VAEVGAFRAQCGAQIRENLLRLGLEIVCPDHLAAPIGRHLPGNEQEVARGYARNV
jgi:hypothetical protein